MTIANIEERQEQNRLRPRMEASGKAPATADRIKAMLDQTPDTLKGKRDRALRTLGMAGVVHRCELVAPQVADLEPAGASATSPALPGHF